MRDITDIPLFQGGSDLFLKALDTDSRVHSHEKGKVLFLHEDPAESFFIIRTGWIKLFRETLDGAQSIVDILTAGQIFGETALFENDQYTYSAEVVEKAEVIHIPMSILKSEIESNNALALNMLSSMARYRKQQDQEIEHRTIQNAPQRIGCFLLRLANQDETGSFQISLPYDKTLVASRLGMQPETFSRALSKLKEKTGIRVKGSVIEVDNLNQLTDFSCAACSSEFPCKDIQAVK